MSSARRWLSRLAAGTVVALLMTGYYYYLQDPVIREHLEGVRTTDTAVSGRVIGLKVVGCSPEEGYILGWGYLAGNKRPVEVKRIGAPPKASGIRDYPLGKSDFGRWEWTAPEGLPMDAVGTTIRYGGACGGRRVTIGPMPVEPPTTGAALLAPIR